MSSIPFQQAVTDPDVFCITWEQVPGRGAVERQQEAILANAEAAAASGRIHAIGVTDNPGGTPALSVEFLSAELARLGVEPLVHLACRDKNRNALESTLFGLERAKVHNLLIVTGDYPAPSGFCGTSRPVFDLDPVHVLQLVNSMNFGHSIDQQGRGMRLAPTSFFPGVAVSPFKKTEAELAGQYLKLRKKIAAGARFAITQIGFDPRKFHELLLWLRLEKISLPVLANIFVLSYPAAKFMAAGNVPGCVVPKPLFEKLAREHSLPDKSRSARIMRAARLYAIVKGMGYAGAHIGGHGISCDMVLEIIQRGDDLAPSWQDIMQEDAETSKTLFYYYFPQGDNASGNLPQPALRHANTVAPIGYRAAHWIHRLIFEPSSPLYPLLSALARYIIRHQALARLLARCEQCIKTVLFRCTDCGDCALPDTAYLCPMSRCAKSQRNGPCGGSDNGWCEVYPGERKCLWVLAYERLRPSCGEKFRCIELVPPCDWGLWQTSSWLNYFLGRDHTSKKCASSSKPSSGL